MFIVFLSHPTSADLRQEITAFRRELEISLREKTGQACLIFQATDAMNTGDTWRARLSRELSEVPVFMPIVQPLYFASEWCVRELLDFQARIAQQPSSGAILPVLWERCQRPAGDAVKAWSILEPLHHFDWTCFRHRDWDEPKRLALNRLAADVVSALDTAGAARPADAGPAPGALEPLAVSFSLSVSDQVQTDTTGEGTVNVPCSGCSIRIVIEATTSQSVVLLALRPVVLSAGAPSGNLLPSAGVVPVRPFTLQLDAPRPRLTSNQPGMDFPFRITQGDPEVIDVQVLTDTGYFLFVLELDWVCAGRQGTTRIDFAGVPFRCMAMPPPPDDQWHP